MRSIGKFLQQISYDYFSFKSFYLIQIIQMKTAVLQVTVKSLRLGEPFKPHTSYIIYLSFAKKSTQIQKQYQSIEESKLVVDQTLRMDCKGLDINKHKYVSVNQCQCLLFVYEIMENGRKNVIGNVPINIRQNSGRGIKSYRLLEPKYVQAMLEVEIKLLEQLQNGRQKEELRQIKRAQQRQLFANISSTLSINSSNMERQVGDHQILRAEDKEDDKNLNKQLSSPSISSVQEPNRSFKASSFGLQKAQLNFEAYVFKKKQGSVLIEPQIASEQKQSAPKLQEINSPVRIFMSRQLEESRQFNIKPISTQAQKQQYLSVQIKGLSPSRSNLSEMKQFQLSSEAVLSSEQDIRMSQVSHNNSNQLNEKLPEDNRQQRLDLSHTFGLYSGRSQGSINLQAKQALLTSQINRELISKNQPINNHHNFTINKVISLAFFNPALNKKAYSKFSKIAVFEQRQNESSQHSSNQDNKGKDYVRLAEMTFLQKRLQIVQSRCSLLVKANQKLTLDHQILKLQLQKSAQNYNLTEQSYKLTIKQLRDEINKMIDQINGEKKLREQQKRQFAQLQKLKELYARENNDMKKKIKQYYEANQWMKKQLSQKAYHQAKLIEQQAIQSSDKERQNQSYRMNTINTTSNKNLYLQMPPLPYPRQKNQGTTTDRKFKDKFNDAISVNNKTKTEYEVILNNSKQVQKYSVHSHQSDKSSVSSKRSESIMKVIGHIPKNAQRRGSVASNSSANGRLIDLLEQEAKVASNLNTSQLSGLKRQKEVEGTKVYFMDKLLNSKDKVRKQ